MGRLRVIEGKGMNRDRDEFGFEAIQDRVGPPDYLATLAHQFGLDYEHLNFQNGAGEESFLDGQSSRIVKEILNSPPA